MIGKKIVPLKFDTWTSYKVDEIGFTQPLFGFTDLRIDQSRQQWIRERCDSQTCPCCQTTIVEQETIRSCVSRITYSACPACRFWRCHIVDGITFGSYSIPSIKEFYTDSETPSLSHLSAEITTQPSLLYNFDPYKFERFVGSVLSDFCDCEVYHVGRTGDDGVDLFAIVKDEPIMIQVKRRSSPTAVEGLDVVKLLFASSFARKVNCGAIVTTATRFSRSAKKWVTSPGLVDTGFEFQLVDFASLMSMIGCVAKKGDPPPWIACRDARAFHQVAEDANWTLTSHESHDYLYRKDSGRGRVLLFDHRSFEDCVLIVGDECRLRTFIESWTPSKELKWPELEFSIRRNTCDVRSEMCVPFDIAEKLSSRWIELYPDKVFEPKPP